MSAVPINIANEYLWLGFLLVDLIVAVLVYRLFGRIGLFALIVMNIIVCNLQVMKFVNLFGLTTTLGNILYASVFFATDILGEKYGKREARRGVWLGFAMLVLATAYMQIALLFAPAESDTIQPALNKIFGLYPRVVGASLIAYLVSQLHDVWAYDFWKRTTQGRHLWLRNNASTMVSQAIDTTLFCSVAFWGLVSLSDFAQILFTTYLLKFIVAAADTPFIYLARMMTPPDLEPASASTPAPSVAEAPNGETE
ncbi:MAG: queuosine precursor transporter [Proteobacteria bacterium]|nr:queuosine precursor transporter [Pseudomonadota bacterium]